MLNRLSVDPSVVSGEAPESVLMVHPRGGLRGSVVARHEVHAGDSAGLVGDARRHVVASHRARVQHGLGVVRVGAVPGGCRGCLSLWFNQAVVFGEGYLFVSEYVNSFNLPAWFSESHPFKVRWDLWLGLKPLRGYVVSWSEDMVKNGAGQGVAAYWMLVELETDVSACSADIVAEGMRGVFECECIDQEEVLVVE